MKLYTIGFTQKSAERFFGLLRASGAKRVIDVRLHNTSQISGFAKQDDLRWFLRELCGMDYVHRTDLAPSEDLLAAWRAGEIDWPTYERRFKALLRERRIETAVPRSLVADACLLCSEPTPENCHRRLLAEHLRDTWGDVEILHVA